MPMSTSTSWPCTRLNWKRPILLSLKLAYFMVLVFFSKKNLGMAMNSWFTQEHRMGFRGVGAAEAAAAAGAALT